MATKPKSTDAIGKVKFRVIEFELEGTDAAMQETIRGFTAALNRNSAGAMPRTLRNTPTKQLEQNSGEAEQEFVGDEAIEAEEVELAAPQPRRPSAPKKVKPLKLLTDFRMDDSEPTLKDFAAQHDTGSNLAKYRVIAYWFKHTKNMPDLTTDHFFTAYRFLGWSTPKDPYTPIDNLRNPARAQFSLGETKGTVTINHVGERLVLDSRKT